MKKWVSSIVVLIIIVVLGGGYGIYHHNQNNFNDYNTAMQNGRSKLNQADYPTAKNDIKKALNFKHKKNDSSAEGLFNQTNMFMSAQNKYNQNKFNDAKQDYNLVVKNDTSNTLSKRAQQQINKINSKLNDMNQVVTEYNQALAFNQDHQFKKSNQMLKQLFQDSNIHNDYYKNILSKAIELNKNNSKSIRSQGSKTTSNKMKPSNKNNSTTKSSSSNSDTTSSSSNHNQNNSNNSNNTNNSTASSNSTSSNSASSNSNSSSANSNYPGSNEFTVNKKQTEINGKSISSQQIANTRKEVNNAGLDSGAMSDQDIRNIMQQANNDHMSVSEYIKQNY